jgi:hypothetical protein
MGRLFTLIIGIKPLLVWDISEKQGIEDENGDPLDYKRCRCKCQPGNINHIRYEG